MAQGMVRPAGGPVYLDYNATTPVDPRVVDAMLPYLSTHFGNPSSGHDYGDEPRQALAQARHRVARLIGAVADEIVFTGSGSEADALALRGAVLGHGGAAVHGANIITQETEHPAVLETCRSLQRLHGVDITYLPVDRYGRVDPHDLAGALTNRTVLVSLMYANNETGTVQPIDELAAIARAHGVLFHTDAAQVVGKISVDVRRLDVDLLTVVGHKMYAPKGIAALFVRSGVRLEPLVGGGGQEQGRRSGTENVALAVALGAAADLAAADLAAGEPARVAELRDGLYQGLLAHLPERVLLNGHPTERLPNTANLAIAPHRGDDVLAVTPQVAASTGSACHAGENQPSPVMAAMVRGSEAGWRGEERARGAIRLTVGRWTTMDDIWLTVSSLAAGADKLGTR
jgi:cysteine desulfurase